mmetsp:Transcript_91094/g.243860  ORF Transcript_91094/g.243860 Transcript_91094/m.243860 type:complete len:234 (-) Transcript_91094:116-817(-)
MATATESFLWLQRPISWLATPPSKTAKRGRELQALVAMILPVHPGLRCTTKKNCGGNENAAASAGQRPRTNPHANSARRRCKLAQTCANKSRAYEPPCATNSSIATRAHGSCTAGTPAGKLTTHRCNTDETCDRRTNCVLILQPQTAQDTHSILHPRPQPRRRRMGTRAGASPQRLEDSEVVPLPSTRDPAGPVHDELQDSLNVPHGPEEETEEVHGTVGHLVVAHWARVVFD